MKGWCEKMQGSALLRFRPMVMSQVGWPPSQWRPFFFFFFSLLVDGMAIEQLLLSGGGEGGHCVGWVGLSESDCRKPS